MSNKQDWFASWFDTPFYHILYKHRDKIEAHDFIDKLFAHLKPLKDELILDLACGRGRHAIYMNQKGFNVLGYDLAEESIQFASQFENDRLHFGVRDMREELGTDQFDWVFNLFTSFGYFDQQEDDLKAMKAISRCLKPGGKLVLDFMNARKVANRLVPQEHKTAGGIDFYIERFTRNEHIIKEIKFKANNESYHFEEKVKTLRKTDFEDLFSATGLELIETFGSLNLDAFDIEKSDRLILIAQKK